MLADGKGIGLSYNSKPRSGTLLLGGSNDMGNASKELQPEVVAGICAYAIACMPALGRLNIIRAWVGLRPYTHGGPVLGLHDATEPYLCAFGHGGDGMALAPVTGHYIAEQVARYPQHLPLDGFLASLSSASQLANLQGKAS
jgi:glycine/D-amino acid oxidase-like deaminating enzyme